MAKYPPRYKKIGGKWYRMRSTWASKKKAQKSVDSWNKANRYDIEPSFSARLVKLAKSYVTKDRKYAIYYRGARRGVVYDSSLPSPKNPVPLELKKWLAKRSGGHTYKIVRYHQDKGRRQRVIKRGLTLAEAKKHCSNPKTKGKTWFDGFTKE